MGPAAERRTAAGDAGATRVEAAERRLGEDSTRAEGPPAPVPGLLETVPQVRRQVRLSLLVGASDDPAEREADALAAQVVEALHAPGAAPLPVPVPGGGGEVRRASRGAVVGDAGGDLGRDGDRALARVSGSGRPLPPAVRAPVEDVLGADLSHVQVHTGPGVGALADAMGAAAFTRGRDVYFPGGVPDLRTRDGAHLLAHELTHTLQAPGVAHRAPTAGSGPVVRRKKTAAEKAAEQQKRDDEAAAKAAKEKKEAELKAWRKQQEAKEKQERAEARASNKAQKAVYAGSASATASAADHHLQSDAERTFIRSVEAVMAEAHDAGFAAFGAAVAAARARGESEAQALAAGEAAARDAEVAVWARQTPDVRAMRPLRYSDYDLRIAEINRVKTEHAALEASEVGSYLKKDQASGGLLTVKDAQKKNREDRLEERRYERKQLRSGSDAAAAAAPGAVAAAPGPAAAKSGDWVPERDAGARDAAVQARQAREAGKRKEHEAQKEYDATRPYPHLHGPLREKVVGDESLDPAAVAQRPLGEKSQHKVAEKVKKKIDNKSDDKLDTVGGILSAASGVAGGAQTAVFKGAATFGTLTTKTKEADALKADASDGYTSVMKSSDDAVTSAVTLGFLAEIQATISEFLKGVRQIQEVRRGGADKGAKLAAVSTIIGSLRGLGSTLSASVRGAEHVMHQYELGGLERVYWDGQERSIFDQAQRVEHAGGNGLLPGIGLATSSIALIKDVLDLVPVAERFFGTLGQRETLQDRGPDGDQVLLLAVGRMLKTSVVQMEQSIFSILKNITMISLHIAELASAGGFGIPAGAKMVISLASLLHSLAHAAREAIEEKLSAQAKEAYFGAHQEGAARAMIVRDPGTAADVLIHAAQYRRDPAAVTLLKHYGVEPQELDTMLHQEVRVKVLAGMKEEGDPQEFRGQIERLLTGLTDKISDGLGDAKPASQADVDNLLVWKKKVKYKGTEEHSAGGLVKMTSSVDASYAKVRKWIISKDPSVPMEELPWSSRDQERRAKRQRQRDEVALTSEFRDDVHYRTTRALARLRLDLAVAHADAIARGDGPSAVRLSYELDFVEREQKARKDPKYVRPARENRPVVSGPRPGNAAAPAGPP